MDVKGVVPTLRELVAARSENPPGDETAVVALAERILVRAGFRVEIEEASPNRPNLVARLSRGPGRRLILQGHADTKPAWAPGTANAWETDPFHLHERDGNLYGLGTCDTKGGLAAQLSAAAELADRGGWSGELVVQVVADEEDGSALGAELLLSRGHLEADAAVVAEPTLNRPSLAQLGNAWAEIHVVGRAAHAGTPGRGVDAFAAAEVYIRTLRSLVDQQPRTAAFPDHPRLNIGHVDVSGHPGSVPAECRLWCDIRVQPQQLRDDVLALYEAAADLADVGEAEIKISRYQGGGCQSHYVAADAEIAEAFRVAQDRTGQPRSTYSFAGGTDARYFAMAGTPAVVYGPGSLDQAHAPNEFVPLEHLLLAEAQLRLVTWHLLESPRG